MTNGLSTGLEVLKRRTFSGRLPGRMGAWVLSALFLASAPSSALAAVVGLVIPNNTGPAVQTVGQTNLPATLTLTHANTGADTGLVNVVTNITLIPSCAVPGTPGCATANPGVYQASATGIGAAGTACGGEIFNISVMNATTGQLLFTPPSPVVLLPPTVSVPQSSCTIVFSLDVRNVPIDVDPGTPEAQTFSTASATFTSTSLVVFTANGQSSTRTINRATPTIDTIASPGIALGAGTLSDTATVSGLVNPGASTVTFRLYGPNDATCTGTPVYVNTQALSVSDSTGTAQSSGFTPTAAGTYRWIASYSGDANNAPVTGACNDPNETSTVIVPVTTFTGATATGTGMATATLSGEGVACGFTSSGFVAAPAPPPAGVTFPQGLFGFTATPCTGTVSVTVTYPNPIPPGAQYYKFGPEPGNPTPHYYIIPATINGNSVTFSVTDGGVGDSDGAANGSITDPGGIGLVALTAGVQGIPTLGEWALLLLMLGMGTMAGLRMRQRG